MRAFFVIFLFLFHISALAQKYTISGYASDFETGESVIGANIFSNDYSVGVSSNKYGFYSITLDEGVHVISFKFIGYETITKEFNLNKDIEFNAEFKLSNIVTDEVTVTGKANVVQRTETSVIEIPVQQIKSIPALMGEVDVLKAVQLLPGVQSSEGTSGFYVRGGSPDQNLILMDGVPVYNVSHIGGLFSVFNADAIKNVRLTKGGFPARYGGRLSSVLEIDMKDGNMKEFKADATAGLISSKLMIEGPIVKDKTSFIVAGRRTYIDLFVKPFMPSNTDLTLHFYDLNAKVNHRFSRKDRLFISAYAGDDIFAVDFTENFSDGSGFNEDTRLIAGLGYGNITSTIRWNHLFGDKLFSNTTLIYSKYQFNTGFGVESTLGTTLGNENYDIDFGYKSGIEDIGGRIDFDYTPNPNHDIKFGVSFTNHNFTPGRSDLSINVSYPPADTNLNISIDTTLNFSPQVKANETFFYFEDNIKFSNRLKANIGIHFGIYNTLNLRSAVNQFSDSDISFEPRLSVRYLLSDTWSAKASYAKMRQNIHLLSNSSVGFPSDLWLPAVDAAPSQNSEQIAASLNTELLNGEIEVSLEGYYKTMNNLITYEAGYSNLESTESWENSIETGGEGESYGIELFIQKQKGKTTGWIGYTLSWSNRKFDNINQGNWYPYKYDRRNDLSIVLNHKFNDRWDYGVTWVYGTGNAITFPRSTYFSTLQSGRNDNFYVWNIESYGDRNSVRLPSYHRLDFGVNRHSHKKNYKGTWSFGAYNLYNRKNPFFAYLAYQNTRRVAKQVSLFPIIPSVSYRIQF
ncbi:TonB-dependent receptor [Bacteroidota bacterium]|nr:TonB-dependent receptor [Bacteroidota bacterium]